MDIVFSGISLPQSAALTAPSSEGALGQSCVSREKLNFTEVSIMLIAIIGENCVGKTTLANKINEKLGAKIYAGKDYLRLEKNPLAAAETFKATLKASIEGNNIIYLITEKEHIQFLPEGAFKIVLSAELEVIKERFKARMRGNLPLPLEKMLEANHGIYDNIPCDMHLENGYDIDAVVDEIKNLSNK